MRVAPEGWPFILPGWALVALGAWVAPGSPWLWVPEAVLCLLAVWLLVFFRDPVRTGPRGERFVIAPADGKVVDVAVVDEPMYLAAKATRISIFMSVFDVHVNRYPATGTIELVRYHRGKFLHAASEKASLDNEQASVGLRAATGPVLVRQIAGLIARRIVTDGQAGDHVGQGERLGMIRFGSRGDVFLPGSARAAVRAGVAALRHREPVGGGVRRSGGHRELRRRARLHHLSARVRERRVGRVDFLLLLRHGGRDPAGPVQPHARGAGQARVHRTALARGRHDAGHVLSVHHDRVVAGSGPLFAAAPPAAVPDDPAHHPDGEQRALRHPAPGGPAQRARALGARHDAV